MSAGQEKLEEVAGFDFLGGLDVPFVTKAHAKLIRYGLLTARMHDEGVRLQLTDEGREAIRQIRRREGYLP